MAAGIALVQGPATDTLIAAVTIALITAVVAIVAMPKRR